MLLLFSFIRDWARSRNENSCRTLSNNDYGGEIERFLAATVRALVAFTLKDHVVVSKLMRLIREIARLVPNKHSSSCKQRPRRRQSTLISLFLLLPLYLWHDKERNPKHSFACMMEAPHVCECGGRKANEAGGWVQLALVEVECLSHAKCQLSIN